MTSNSYRPPSSGIELTGLVKTFRSPEGPVQAVRGVGISIAPGETVALLGPNGAGKSTTIDVLHSGLLPPDVGTVSLFRPAHAISRGTVGAMLQTGSRSVLVAARDGATVADIAGKLIRSWPWWPADSSVCAVRARVGRVEWWRGYSGCTA